MSSLDERAGSPVPGVEFVVVGEGPPVTVFAHGLGGSIAETRPLAAGVPGTRVLMHFRGHGGSAALADGWDYDLLAADLLAVADAVGATRAVGLSLGAGALLHLVAATPGRFERLAFVLPAALDRGRSDGATERLHRLAAAMRANDVDRLTTLLLAEVPPPLRQHRAARVLTARRARELAGTEPPEPRTDVRPLESLADLTTVVAPSLVLAQHDDDLHTVEIAETLAEALPNAELVVLPAGGIFWTARFEARDVLARHLAERP